MQIFRFRWIIKPLAAGLLPCLLMPASYAQTPGAQTPAPTALPIPPASGATGKFTAFDVASVRENKTNAQMNSNFPMGPGNVFIPSGGLFHATSVPLLVYIYFAYKLTGVYDYMRMKSATRPYTDDTIAWLKVAIGR